MNSHALECETYTKFKNLNYFQIAKLCTNVEAVDQVLKMEILVSYIEDIINS